MIYSNTKPEQERMPRTPRRNEILIQDKKIPFFSKQSIRTRLYYINKDIARLFYYCYYDYELLGLLS